LPPPLALSARDLSPDFNLAEHRKNDKQFDDQAAPARDHIPRNRQSLLKQTAMTR
jgi:hypothetical protein